MNDAISTAASTLEKALKVVTTERGQQHGPLKDSFHMVAQMWSVYLNNATKARTGEDLGLSVTAFDVAQMMTTYKQCRSVFGDPQNMDNYVDGAGFQGLAAAIIAPEKSTEKDDKEQADKLAKATAEAAAEHERQRALTRKISVAQGAVTVPPAKHTDIRA